MMTERITVPGGGVLTSTLISRRSSEHAGTRFKTRGLNDAGGAANFVETEQLLHMTTPRASACAAYVLLRGSVPVFWEQRGKTVSPKPRTLPSPLLPVVPFAMRSLPHSPRCHVAGTTRVIELTLPALREHLGSLRTTYCAYGSTPSPLLLDLFEHVLLDLFCLLLG